MTAVLPWLRVPLRVEAGAGVPLSAADGSDGDASAVRGLPQNLRLALERPPRSFRELLPVQAAAWAQLGGGLSDAHDLCLAAPTGSGKTLAYALPVVHALAVERQRGVGGSDDNDNDDLDRPLRALIVVPTRDLAVQVHALVRDLCEATAAPGGGLRAALAAAQRPAAEEAAAATGVRAQAAAALLPPMACDAAQGGAQHQQKQQMLLRGGGGRADVLVATPGRLTAMLPGGAGRWPALCLSHLRFLVVDEADRLLRQAYQDWLPRVLEAAAAGGSSAGTSRDSLLPLLPCSAAPPRGQGARLVKMIVSATLTRDPSKLARFELYQPRYVALVDGGSLRAPVGGGGDGDGAAAAVAAQEGEEEEQDDDEEQQEEDEHDEDKEADEKEAERPSSQQPPQQQRAPANDDDDAAARFLLPATLEQRQLVAQAHRKPLALASLLRELGPQQRTLVFCSSVDTTRRLYLLLSALLGRGALPCGVAELGGHLSAAKRRDAVESLRSGRAGVLVSSDAMARGMDVAGVRTVVCYDFPPSARAYVHRAGRAARAGAEGVVVSLLRPQEVVHFRRLLKGKIGGGASGGKVREWRVGREHLDAMGPALRGAMVQVRELLESEGVMGAAGGGGGGGAGGGGGGGEAGAAAAAAAARDRQEEDEQQPEAEAAQADDDPSSTKKRRTTE
jgi:ATP-dependent RNA helicase DDX51/DBP6